MPLQVIRPERRQICSGVCARKVGRLGAIPIIRSNNQFHSEKQGLSSFLTTPKRLWSLQALLWGQNAAGNQIVVRFNQLKKASGQSDTSMLKASLFSEDVTPCGPNDWKVSNCKDKIITWRKEKHPTLGPVKITPPRNSMLKQVYRNCPIQQALTRATSKAIMRLSAKQAQTTN